MNPSAALPLPASAAPDATGAASDAHEQPPHGELVTVTRVFNALEAEMLRGCLQAEGIPATLGDVQTVQTDTLLTVALGGIRVMVPAACAAAARLTVEAFERGALAIEDLPDEPVAAEPDPPERAGLRLSRGTWVVVALVVAAVIVF